MKLLKPTWVTHDGKPIFSINIHPDGSKFATGGQGDDSGRVVIWNMAPIISEKKEQDPNVPKLLCQMDNHLACVNCVRWSNSGQYLASGGDDKLVMIWQMSRYPGGSTIFGGGGKTNVEHWRCVSTLRGHSGDVLDLGWSSDDRYLASSSVDNTIRVWNMLNMPESIAVLKGHTGLVKGIAWDPIGKYVASQSDDKSVRVWKTSDWKQEAVVTEPFEECGGTTHVLRLDWSPDGQYLVSAHAMNGGGPTAQIIERDGWKTDKDFVGHRKAITCVSFNSSMLRKPTAHKGTSYCCCAIGSRDRSLSIWLTALKRPLVVVHELFQNSILDLSWSRCGYKLMACSWDGSVAYIELKESELGQVVGVEEKESLFQRMYGKKSFTVGVNNHATSVIEDADWIQPQSVSLMDEDVGGVVGGATDAMSNDSRASSKQSGQMFVKGPIDKQIETRTVDGRRRITPVFIPPPMDVDDAAAAPMVSSASSPPPSATAAIAAPTFSSSTESRSRIVIEKRDQVTKPGLQNSNISPGEASSLVGVAPGQAARKELSSILLNRRLERNESQRSVASVRVAAASVNDGAAVSVSIPVALTPAADKIAPLGPQKNITVQAPGGKSIEIENQSHSVGHKISVHKMTCISGGKVQWDVGLASATVACVATSCSVVTACSDSTLHCFSISDGSRLMAAVKLQAPAALLRAQDHLVCVITTQAHMTVWNMKDRKSILKTCLQHLISPEASSNITSCTLRSCGTPVVGLSNGKSFTYSADMESWLQLSDSQDPLRQGSDVQGLPSNGTVGQGAQSATNSSGAAGANQRRINNNSEAKILCTVSYIDCKLSALLELESPAEYRTWFLAKVKYMAQQGIENRLRCLCQDLLGPAHRSAQRSQSWQPTIMGISKHELLQQSLQLMATNVKLQRLCTEFQQQLNMLKHQ